MPAKKTTTTDTTKEAPKKQDAAPENKAKDAAPDTKGADAGSKAEKAAKSTDGMSVEERLQHAADEALWAKFEADPKGTIIAMHRNLEYLANMHNIALPG